MQLQKFIICTFKNPDGSTYEGAAITEEAYNSESFRRNFELKIKKARLVSFDSPDYLKLSGLTREEVDSLRPKPQVIVPKTIEKPFEFPSLDKLDKEDISKPKLPQAKEVKKRGRKPKTAV